MIDERYVEAVAVKVVDILDAKGKSKGKGPERRYLSYEETAEYLGTTREGVKHMVKKKGLRKIKDGKKVLFDKKDIDLYMERNKVLAA